MEVAIDCILTSLSGLWRIGGSSLLNGLFLIFGLVWGYNPGLEFGSLYEVEGGG